MGPQNDAPLGLFCKKTNHFGTTDSHGNQLAACLIGLEKVTRHASRDNGALTHRSSLVDS